MVRARLALSGMVVLSLLGCGNPFGPLDASSRTTLSAKAVSTQASILTAEQVPAALRTSVHRAIQQAADAASEKRGLDFFNVHANPVGLRLTNGQQNAYVLSFLGTSKETPSINYEARALVAGGKVGLSSNYSGSGTRAAETQHVLPMIASADADYRFELLMGLPGNGLTDVYERHMTRLADFLTRRFQARPFHFGEDAFVFALHHGDTLQGFLFTHQRNRLVLGERKDADVQSVVFMSPSAEILGAYTLVGFNDKTPDANTPPRYTWESTPGFGPIAIFGDH